VKYNSEVLRFDDPEFQRVLHQCYLPIQARNFSRLTPTTHTIPLHPSLAINNAISFGVLIEAECVHKVLFEVLSNFAHIAGLGGID